MHLIEPSHFAGPRGAGIRRLTGKRQTENSRKAILEGRTYQANSFYYRKICIWKTSNFVFMLLCPSTM